MYGLLGKKLSHSFSKEIHEHFTKHDYTLIERDTVNNFMTAKDFKGINVTIPYKKAVLPFLDHLSEEAKMIGVVNAITNEDGILTGYNTDIYGLEQSLLYNNITVTNKDVLIIGNGSTSRTIEYFCKLNNAKNIYKVARTPKENEYPLSDINSFHHCQILFNATPVGMYPNNDTSITMSLGLFHQLEFVMDVVYNPLKTNLLLAAEEQQVKTSNGLLMLVFQAVKAIELFHNTIIDHNSVIHYYKNLLEKLTNFVFIGMPMSGKSFFTKLVGQRHHKTIVDLDNEIESTNRMPIPEIFETEGEKHFRKLETKEVKRFSKLSNMAISCGGGVITKKENMHFLKQNGLIIFIDFALEDLYKCNPKGRPLLKNRNNLEKLYKERYNLYREYADIHVNKESYDENVTLNKIEVKINEYFNS